MSFPIECMTGGSEQSRSQARRQRVIDVSRTLFSERGFHATGMAQIAKESGVAIAQIYRDFRSKEEIVASIVEHDCSAMLDNDALRAAIAARDETAILAWIAHVVDPASLSTADVRIFNEIIAESSRNDRMATIFQTTHDQVRTTLCLALNIFEPGEAKAERRKLLADMILTLAIGLRHHPIIENQVLNDALIKSFQRIIRQEISNLRVRE